MDYRVQDLFTSPLWTFNLADIDNEQLAEEGANQVGNVDFFLAPGPTIKLLKERIEDALEIAKERYPGPPMGYRYDLTGRQKIILPKQNDTPHHHSNSMLVGVYYVTVPKESGDILLHDPRGAIQGKYLWGYPECIQETYQPRPFYRIKPKPGMLIIFPGYLIHSVESNVSSEVRRSIVLTAGQ